MSRTLTVDQPICGPVDRIDKPHRSVRIGFQKSFIQLVYKAVIEVCVEMGRTYKYLGHLYTN